MTASPSQEPAGIDGGAGGLLAGAVEEDDVGLADGGVDDVGALRRAHDGVGDLRVGHQHVLDVARQVDDHGLADAERQEPRAGLAARLGRRGAIIARPRG